MRARLLLVLLLVAGRVQAQGYVGGFVLDSATGAPLPCVQVALVDTVGHLVARQITTSEGMFQLDAPPKGSYRLRFATWTSRPLFGPIEELEPSVERARKYQLNFVVDTTFVIPRSDTSFGAPPGPPRDMRTAIRYPDYLRHAGVQGKVVVSYVVDSLGYVVPMSVSVRSSTEPGFETEVRSYLRRTQFRPATLGGRPVCALMRDTPYTFSLGPGR